MARFEDYRVFKTAVGGRLLQLEIGKVCEQANGQVMVKYGDTVVNVTACASKEPKPDIDFFPLSVDYEERMYAAGKIPGGFIKREGKAKPLQLTFCCFSHHFRRQLIYFAAAQNRSFLPYFSHQIHIVLYIIVCFQRHPKIRIYHSAVKSHYAFRL